MLFNQLNMSWAWIGHGSSKMSVFECFVQHSLQTQKLGPTGGTPLNRNWEISVEENWSSAPVHLPIGRLAHICLPRYLGTYFRSEKTGMNFKARLVTGWSRNFAVAVNAGSILQASFNVLNGTRIGRILVPFELFIALCWWTCLMWSLMGFCRIDEGRRINRLEIVSYLRHCQLNVFKSSFKILFYFFETHFAWLFKFKKINCGGMWW